MHVQLAVIKLLLALIKPPVLNKNYFQKNLILTSGKTKHEKKHII